MKITRDMMHPELRLVGSIIRKVHRFRSEKTFINLQKLMNLVKKFMKTRKIQYNYTRIKTPDNSNLRVCICKSFEPKPNAIGLLWIHGGGYAIGAPEQDFSFMRNFIEAANCVVVSPDYRLSIEEPYPAAVNDCYHTLLWMNKNADKLGICSDQLFVGGDSAGGGLTAAVSLMARDKGKVRIAFQMPFYPMLDDRMVTPSSQNNDAPIWDSHANKVAWKLYLGDLYETDQIPPYAAPARETDYSRLPPTYTFVGDIEPFCDETKEYIANLQAADVEAELDVYQGCFHAFDIAGAGTKIGKEAAAKYIEQFQYAAKHYFASQPIK